MSPVAYQVTHVSKARRRKREIEVVLTYRSAISSSLSLSDRTEDRGVSSESESGSLAALFA